MEQKLVRVPFEVDLAKRIQSGECKGKIVTRSDKNVRIVCWNYHSMSGNYPLLALVSEDRQEVPFPYSEKGQYNIYGYNKEDSLDLMLEVPEYMTFKDGDVIAFGVINTFIGIFKSFGYSIDTHSDYAVLIHENNVLFDGNAWTFINSRKATEAEKQKLIDALKSSKEPKAKDCLKRFFGIEQKQEYEFKPLDKVICRDDYSEWFVDMFSHIDKNGLYACIGQVWNHCLPYNDQTKHLLGTTKSWEE